MRYYINVTDGEAEAFTSRRDAINDLIIDNGMEARINRGYEHTIILDLSPDGSVLSSVIDNYSIHLDANQLVCDSNAGVHPEDSRLSFGEHPEMSPLAREAFDMLADAAQAYVRV